LLKRKSVGIQKQQARITTFSLLFDLSDAQVFSLARLAEIIA